MNTKKISELVKLPEFADFSSDNYRKSSIGYIHRHVDSEENVLVGYRNKRSDPLRENLIVLPCGGVEKGESYEDAIIRETKEETCVDTELTDPPVFSAIMKAPYLKEYGDVVSVINENGLMWIFARDNGKKYVGKLFDLKPLSEPYETASDLKRPHYVSLKWLVKNEEGVMPEERLSLDIIAEKELIRLIENKVLLDKEDFSGFMKEAGLL